MAVNNPSELPSPPGVNDKAGQLLDWRLTFGPRLGLGVRPQQAMEYRGEPAGRSVPALDDPDPARYKAMEWTTDHALPNRVGPSELG